MKSLIIPRALAIAAKTFRDKPAVLGEILVAIATDEEPKRLTDVQRYIVADCREELRELAGRRAAAAERKRRQRNGGAR